MTLLEQLKSRVSGYIARITEREMITNFLLKTLKEERSQGELSEHEEILYVLITLV
jgi:hypothetical protein